MSAARASRTEAPPLEMGDRLTQAEFHRRYELHPDLHHAELIEGVVYLPSPVGFEQHGEPQGMIIGWLAAYVAAHAQHVLAALVASSSMATTNPNRTPSCCCARKLVGRRG